MGDGFKFMRDTIFEVKRMVNKIIKICGPIVQILVVTGFVLMSLPMDSDDSSFVTNINSTSKVSVSYGDFVASDIVLSKDDDNEVLPIVGKNDEKVIDKDTKGNNTVDKNNNSNNNSNNINNTRNSDSSSLDNSSDDNSIKEEVIDVMSYKAIDNYIGTLTGYGPDCKGCKSGKTASGYRVASVVDGVVQKADRITYDDDTYGEIRILAAAYDKFPNGTVIRVSSFSYYDKPFLGIVIDTGATMRNAWKNGNIWIDLMFASENDPEIKAFGIDKDVTFEVLRYGF